MIGIRAIGVYIPEARESNLAKQNQFGVDESFIREKLGILQTARKGENEETSDLCVKAFEALAEKPAKGEIEAVVVITQNPDFSLPHTSAIVHGKLGLSERCACFDVSLGCSGFVYGLSVLQSFMEANGLRNALLFTADPYSKVVDENDKNTSMLFGDAAAVTWLSDSSPILLAGRFTFGTIGTRHTSLLVKDGTLSMNGRDIFNFAATNIPRDIELLLERNSLSREQIDKFLFHPGSKFIVDTLLSRLDIPAEKARFGIEDYGNTVSSSIPILLADELHGKAKHIIISGFGVGLSWASTVLRRSE